MRGVANNGRQPTVAARECGARSERLPGSKVHPRPDANIREEILLHISREAEDDLGAGFHTHILDASLYLLSEALDERQA
jgi:hypothetical protein